MPDNTTRIVFLHSSNEMYGADRVLLQVVTSLEHVPGAVPEVWFPDDVVPSENNVADHLAAAGVSTRVRSLPILRRKNLRLTRLPLLAVSLVRLWWALVRERPTVVYLGTSACLLGAIAARAAGVRAIVLHNQEIWSGREGKLLGVFARMCTRIICISSATLSSMPQSCERRAVLIPNAVPEPAIVTRPEVHGGPTRLLIASRWNAWKGHATLLAAMERSTNPNGLHLTVLGDMPLVGVGVNVNELVAHMSDPGSVTIEGQVDEIGQYIDAADFVAMPSDEDEPFGLIAIEAFARARPVVASNGGGLGSIVTDGVDGLLFDNRDVDGLVAILDRLSSELSATMGPAARDSYDREFSLGSMNHRLAEFWPTVLKRQ